MKNKLTKKTDKSMVIGEYFQIYSLVLFYLASYPPVSRCLVRVQQGKVRIIVSIYINIRQTTNTCNYSIYVHVLGLTQHRPICLVSIVSRKPGVKRPLKTDKTKILMTNGSQMNVESKGSILQYFCHALNDNWC